MSNNNNGQITPDLLENENIKYLLAYAKRIIPARFIEGIDDLTLLTYLDLTLQFFNYTPPLTGFKLENMPKPLIPLIALGGQMFGTLFLAGGYALNDFNYSDGGLSLNIDRQGNLDKYYQNLYNLYLDQVKKFKKIYAMRMPMKIIQTPTTNTIFAQYLAMMFPTTFDLMKWCSLQYLI